jgi:hypothetical protein
MNSILRDLAFISVACVLSALAFLTIPVVYVWSVSGCDVYDDHLAPSPDGRWEAHRTTTGCHGLLLSTNFYSKVTIRDTSKGPPKHVPVIFECDSAEPATLTWVGHDTLEVEIREITEVYRSLRSYDGIHITYSVTPKVIQSIGNIENHIGKGRGHLEPADERVAKKIDEDYRRYLSRFRDWIQLYASD